MTLEKKSDDGAAVTLRGSRVRLQSSNGGPQMSIYVADCYTTTDDVGNEIAGPVEITIKSLAATQNTEPQVTK